MLFRSQPRVEPVRPQEHIRPEPEPLEHTRPVRVDENVRARDEPPQQREPRGALHVEHDRTLVPRERVARRCRVGAVDPDDVGAPVGEDEAGEGPRGEAGELDECAVRLSLCDATRIAGEGDGRTSTTRIPSNAI